jgi:hypothetical protein
MMFKACYTIQLYYNKCNNLSRVPLVNVDSTLVKRLSSNGVNKELLSKRAFVNNKGCSNSFTIVSPK